MDEGGPKLNEGLPEGRAELLQTLKTRGLDNAAFKNAAAAWLEQIPEEEEGPYRMGLTRQLASAGVLQDAGYLADALGTLDELLSELDGVREEMPILHERAYEAVLQRYEDLLRVIGELEQAGLPTKPERL